MTRQASIRLWTSVLLTVVLLIAALPTALTMIIDVAYNCEHLYRLLPDYSLPIIPSTTFDTRTGASEHMSPPGGRDKPK